MGDYIVKLQENSCAVKTAKIYSGTKRAENFWNRTEEAALSSTKIDERLGRLSVIWADQLYRIHHCS